MEIRVMYTVWHFKGKENHHAAFVTTDKVAAKSKLYFDEIFLEGCKYNPRLRFMELENNF